MRLGYSKLFSYTMGAAIIWSVVSLVRTPPSLLAALFIALFTIFMTDLISGLLHVILDNPRSLDVAPIRGLAEGFQRHHDTPSNIYEMPLYQHLYVMHMPLTLFFLVVLPFHESLMYVVFLSMCGSLHLMQMAHLWAHLGPEQVPAPVQMLQRARILLSKPQHDKHHTAPYEKDHCIMTGMCNPVLNLATRVFGGTSHWWNAAFIAVALSPLAVAFALS